MLPITDAARAGPSSPVAGSPPRRDGSVRRTCSTDARRPEGAGGPIRLHAVARDLVRDAAGAERARQVELETWLEPDRRVRTITATPPVAGLDSLVGATSATGFRAAVNRAVPEERERASLLHLLLDDLPVVTLISGHSLQRAGEVARAPRATYDPVVDLCSGWRAGGTLMLTVEREGVPPMTLGPPAPALDRAGDPTGWHALPEALPHTVRRRRRIDLVVGDALHVDAMFRDSHFDEDGVETAIHEYGLVVSVDAETLVVTTIEAEPHVLPYVECPSAAASAARLTGMHLDEVRDRVRNELTGTSTCTHLNDLLRSLADVRGMLLEVGWPPQP